ncbi:MAG: hypothetical protein V7603_6828 [Micromonosporaceae bacterium]|jgi:hypothetical protein
MAITVVNFSNGVRWELPEGVDREALIAGIKSAMQRKGVYEYQAEWGSGDAQRLLFNGAVLDFVAIGDKPSTEGHPARGLAGKDMEHTVS